MKLYYSEPSFQETVLVLANKIPLLEKAEREDFWYVGETSKVFSRGKS